MRECAWVWALVSATGGSSEVLEALAPTQGGLTVAQAMERAIATAPAVMKAEAERQSRESTAGVAFLAFTPRLDGFASYNRLSRTAPDDPLLEMVFPSVQNNYSLRAGLSIPVSDYFLTALHDYRAAFVVAEAAAYQAHASKEAAGLRAVEAYLNLVRARAAEIVVQKSIDVLSAEYEDLVQLANAGMSTQGDVLQVKAQLASARVQHEQAKGMIEVARQVLKRTIHDDQATLEHGEDMFAAVDRPVLPMKEALDVALSERAEVKALVRVISAREKQVSSAFGRLFPRLTVDGQAEYAKPNQRTFYDPETFHGTWGIAVNLSWSPNDSILAHSDTSKAEDEVAAARADLAELSDAIAVEVADAVSSYRARLESIGAAREAVEAAQGTFTDRQNLLNAGEGTTRELLLSLQDLRLAQLQLVNAHLDLRLSLAQIDRALGRLVKQPEE